MDMSEREKFLRTSGIFNLNYVHICVCIYKYIYVKLLVKTVKALE